MREQRFALWLAIHPRRKAAAPLKLLHDLQRVAPLENEFSAAIKPQLR